MNYWCDSDTDWLSTWFRATHKREDVSKCPHCDGSFWDFRPVSIMVTPENEHGITEYIMPICLECFGELGIEVTMSYCEALIGDWDVVKDTVEASITEMKFTGEYNGNLCVMR